jgi:TP53 regulating kinase-like protein
VEKLIRRGAEADLYLGEWYGRPAIRKVRTPKPYRLGQLDAQLRRHRTLREAEYLHRARQLGVETPIVYYLDPNQAEIIMQFIPGNRVREALQKDHAGRARISRAIGRAIGHLHRGGLVHGDLTTSNFIVQASGRLVLLDFGLAFQSRRLEDHAVDLHVLDQVLRSAHQRLASDVYPPLLAAYARQVGATRAHAVGRQRQEIERRGRYTRVV